MLPEKFAVVLHTLNALLPSLAHGPTLYCTREPTHQNLRITTAAKGGCPERSSMISGKQPSIKNRYVLFSESMQNIEPSRCCDDYWIMQSRGRRVALDATGRVSCIEA